MSNTAPIQPSPAPASAGTTLPNKHAAQTGRQRTISNAQWGVCAGAILTSGHKHRRGLLLPLPDAAPHKVTCVRWQANEDNTHRESEVKADEACRDGTHMQSWRVRVVSAPQHAIEASGRRAASNIGRGLRLLRLSVQNPRWEADVFSISRGQWSLPQATRTTAEDSKPPPRPRINIR